MKKILSILIMVLSFVTLFGCQFQVTTKTTSTKEDGIYHRNEKVTDKKLWEANENVAVIKDDSSEMIEYALSEFEDIFETATELRLVTLYESEVEIEEDSFYFFIGETDRILDEKIDHSYELLGDSGIVIKTIGNITYITGATDKGTLYAVYEFMSVMFEYEFYAEDEVYIGDGTDMDYLEMDYVYRPNVANPCLMAGELNYNSELYYKYRFQNYYETWMAADGETYYAHTYFKIMPKSRYYDEHPDWYSPDGNNLCLTCDEDMVFEFVENCKEIILKDNVHKYFMFGQEDNFLFCDCESCQERIEYFDGFSSAVMMEFTNKVVRELNSWLEETDPDRNITFVTFAYNHTKYAPVYYDENTKTYYPVDESIKAEKNLSVQLVINMCDYYAPYSNSKTIVQSLDGWSAITDNMTIWEYATNFENYMDCFDNFNSLAANIKLLSSHGVDYIVEQAAYNTCTSAFSELKLYLMSKLMWDAELDTDMLIDNFLFYYYKDAYEEVKAYFDAIYSHVDELVEENGITVRSGGNECMIKQNWSYTLLNKIKNEANAAYQAIEQYKDTNTKRYNLIYSRIEKQALWVDYYIYKFYPIYLEDPVAYFNDWKAIARKYKITLIQEGLAV